MVGLLLTLDDWAQDPAFVLVQRSARYRWPEQWSLLEDAIEACGRELGSFTAEDVIHRAGGRDELPRNLIGSVLGAWSAAGALRVVGRQRSHHSAAKGRWVNRFVLTLPVSESRRNIPGADGASGGQRPGVRPPGAAAPGSDDPGRSTSSP